MAVTEREKVLAVWLDRWSRRFNKEVVPDDMSYYDRLTAEIDKADVLDQACEGAAKACHFFPQPADILDAYAVLCREFRATRLKEEDSFSPLTREERETLCRESRERLAHILKGAKAK